MREEPLENWLFITEIEVDTEPEVEQRQHEAGRQALDSLEALLAQPRDAKINYYNARVMFLGTRLGFGLPSEECARAERLYRQMWERGGNGSAYAQEELLSVIAVCRYPSSIPFWLEVLDLSKPRDQFATQRRTLALAALALLAIQKDDQAAYTALGQALQHTLPQVRALAAFYLGCAYFVPDRPLPTPMEALLRQIALNDTAFEPRYQARIGLSRLGRAVPLDHQGGVYRFDVRLTWAKDVTRTLALRAEQTLSELHLAIQRAFEWDNDHLYSFFMNGRRNDVLYEIPCPELDLESFDLLDWNIYSMPHDGAEEEVQGEAEIEAEEYDEADADEDAEADEEAAFTTAEAVIGDLGLTLKHTFVYFFDYGDSHEFEVKVVGIEAQADGGEYPRLVGSKGVAPAQYSSWEGEDAADGD